MKNAEKPKKKTDKTNKRNKLKTENKEPNGKQKKNRGKHKLKMLNKKNGILAKEKVCQHSHDSELIMLMLYTQKFARADTYNLDLLNTTCGWIVKRAVVYPVHHVS